MKTFLPTTKKNIMVERLKKTKTKEHPWLLDYLDNNEDADFYYTQDNARLYIRDGRSLKNLLKNSEHIYTLSDEEGYVGVILVWKSFGGGKKRYYVKINASNPDIAQKLLTVLLWNIDIDLFIKMRKNNKFLSIFKNKGFRFQGGRGIQILLKRKYIKPRNYNGSDINKY